MGKTLIFKHGQGIIDDASQLDYGELSVSYGEGEEALSLKNSNNEIATIKFSVVDDVNEHISDTDNPHGVTAAQVGLGNVENHGDEDLDVSAAMQEILDTKLDVAKVYSASFYTTDDDGNTALRDDVDEDTYSEYAWSAASGYSLYTSVETYINGDYSDIESRISAIEEYLTAE